MFGGLGVRIDQPYAFNLNAKATVKGATIKLVN